MEILHPQVKEKGAEVLLPAVEFNEHLNFYHILPFHKYEFQAFSTQCLGGKGGKNRTEERTFQKKAQEMDSLIYTHSKWIIELILNISGSQTTFNRKKKKSDN